MNITMTRNRQGGMTYLGMLILLIIIAFAAIIVIKVVPVYLENFKVDSSLKSLEQEPKDHLATMSPGELETLLMKRLQVNDVEHVKKENIKIVKNSGKIMVDVSYEVRIPLFFNIDLIARFPDNHADLGGP